MIGRHDDIPREGDVVGADGVPSTAVATEHGLRRMEP
jgi:hypothetical protein